MNRWSFLLCGGAAVIAFGANSLAGNAVESTSSISGNWQLDIVAKPSPGKEIKGSFTIDPVAPIKVPGERCDKLPDFNPKAWGGWQKGYAFKAIKAQECAVKGALDPLSVRVSDGPSANSTIYVKGKDYDAELEWGSVGRLPGGEIQEKQTVFISYEYSPQRIDTIALSADGKSLLLKKGVADVVLPKAPSLDEGETPVVNIYLPGRLSKLNEENIFPVTEIKFPDELADKAKGSAEKLLPKTLAKLRNGEHLKILAWGDSVTDGGFLPEKDKNRWQAQFVTRLKEKYPKADIELATEAWGGHNSAQYLAEPPGSVHNYKEKVLAAKPDLIVLEFVNDAGLKKDAVNERYGKFLAEFNEIGAEWIINTPHYIRPDWMGLKSQKNIDDDPREYVKALREFCASNNVALADTSMRYGRLWRQGIPYGTMMSNNINHPEPRGMAIFADALINLFP